VDAKKARHCSNSCKSPYRRCKVKLHLYDYRVNQELARLEHEFRNFRHINNCGCLEALLRPTSNLPSFVEAERTVVKGRLVSQTRSMLAYGI
jgi:hypothetical protein